MGLNGDWAAEGAGFSASRASVLTLRSLSRALLRRDVLSIQSAVHSLDGDRGGWRARRSGNGGSLVGSGRGQESERG